MAIIQALEYMNDGYDWIVDIDLERFFDTVHHDRLMNLVSRTIDDGDVISLIRKFLVSGVQIDGRFEKTPIGRPQGGLCEALHNPPYANKNIMQSKLSKANKHITFYSIYFA